MASPFDSPLQRKVDESINTSECMMNGLEYDDAANRLLAYTRTYRIRAKFGGPAMDNANAHLLSLLKEFKLLAERAFECRRAQPPRKWWNEGVDGNLGMDYDTVANNVDKLVAEADFWLTEPAESL